MITRTFRGLFLLILLAVPCAIRPAAFKSGSVTCASAVKTISTTSTKVSAITFQTPANNGGVIALGGSNVTAVANCNQTSAGVCLNASASVAFPALSNTAAYDLSQIWIACTVAADTLSYTYVQ